VNKRSIPQATPKVFPRLPAGIWALGFVSLFMDISSELIHSLLPLFMASVLGASMTVIGLVEGIAEGTASIARLFSGALSDWLERRKPLLLAGYGLSALTKPVFPLADSIGWVFIARFADRVGKGIRVAPRDALVADLATPNQRGAAYGLRQALDSLGALLGPLLAMAGIVWLTDNISSVMWLAVLPAFIAIAIIVFAVPEPAKPALKAGKARKPLRWRDIGRLNLAYWAIVLLGFVFTLARFSEAFLVLRADNVGMPLSYVPLIMVAMSGVYAATAYPAGMAADRFDRRYLLVAGLIVLVLADLLLAIAWMPVLVIVGAALWGMHMGLTQGLLAALIADASPSRLRGTAFGIFNLVSGIALIVASLFAGLLWDRLGAGATFTAGASFALLAATGLLLYRPSIAR